MCIDFIINVFFLFLINNWVIRKACLLSKTCVSSNYTGGKAVKKKQTRNLSLSLLCSAGIKTYEKAVTGSDWACFSDKTQTRSEWNISSVGKGTVVHKMNSSKARMYLTILHLRVRWKLKLWPLRKIVFLQQLLGETFMFTCSSIINIHFRCYIAQKNVHFPHICVAFKKNTHSFLITSQL